MKLIDFVLKNITIDRAAFINGVNQYSYELLGRYVTTLIHKLAHCGLYKGQRVILVADHDEDAIVFLAAASALGLQVVLPYNLHNSAVAEWEEMIATLRHDYLVYLKKDESLFAQISVAHQNVIKLRLSDCDLEVESFDNGSVTVLSQPVENFLLLYTSGTTGHPKIISISELLVCKRVLSVTAKLHFTAATRAFMSGLINNTTGIIFAFGSIYHGSTLIFPQTCDVAKWPHELLANQVSHIMFRPAMMRIFVDSIGQSDMILESLQVIAYGAAPMRCSLLERAMLLFPCKWIQGYGLSETFGPFCWLDEHDHYNKRYCSEATQCIGKPDQTVAIKIKDGELMLQGDMLMAGYFSALADKEEAVAGWFATGDYVERDNEGYLYLKGRINTTVLSADGHCIYPEEIESVINKIAGINEVIFVNLPVHNDVRGISVLCLQFQRLNMDDKMIRTIIGDHCQRFLSREKWPEFIYLFATPLPKNPNDKINRRAVVAAINRDKLIKFV